MMKNARELFFLWKYVLLCSASFFTLRASVIVPSDIEMLLKHAQLELHNPLLFDAGVADLALVFHHGAYKKDPHLEKEFISLVRYAQAHASPSSLLVAPFLKEVITKYKGSRYGLELTLLASKKEFTLEVEEKEHFCKTRKERENEGEEKEDERSSVKSQDEADLAFLYSVSSARRARVKKATIKKVAVSRAKKTRSKRSTKKEKAEKKELIVPQAVESVGGLDLSLGSSESVSAPVRKKRISKKKESSESEGQVLEAPVKKRASRKKVDLISDESGQPEVPKKRASRKKVA